MREKFPDVVERARTRKGDDYQTERGDRYGEFVLKAPTGRYLRCLVDEGSVTRWDHVSVSVMDHAGRSAEVPSWEEMCWVKGLFWGPEETVIQYHPPESVRVNIREVLHLWRPLDEAVPLPPRGCV